MTITEYAKPLEYIQQNNCWGINMHHDAMTNTIQFKL